MLEQAQGVLSKSTRTFASSGTTIKSFAASHPVGVGIILGLGAYYAISKFWLDADNEEHATVIDDATATE